LNVPESVKAKLRSWWHDRQGHPKGKNPGDVVKYARVEPRTLEGWWKVNAPRTTHPKGKNPGDTWKWSEDTKEMAWYHNLGKIRQRMRELGLPEQNPLGRNPGDFWGISTKPFPEAHFACVSEDTECLTYHGWKKWYELRRGEYIATYNMKEKIIELQPVLWIKTYDYDGELIHVGNRDLDILMTPNHRNIVKKRKSGKEKIVLAENLAHSDKIRVKAPVKWIENQGIGETLARLMGWIISEGHYNPSNIEIYQNVGEHEAEIDEILKRLDIPHTKRIRERRNGKKEVTWRLLRSPWVEMIKSIAPNKKLNHFLVSLPLNECKALFEAIIKGDGHVRKDDGRISNTMKDKENQDWFQILALRLGYRATIGVKDVHLTKKDYIGLRGTNGKGKNISKVRYKGKVWCPRTKNGTWVARRNGRIFITGNTYPEDICIRPIKASCPEQVCVKCGLPKESHPGWCPSCKCEKPEYMPGVVLDPMCGSGTTLVVAKKLGRQFIGIDINPAYVEMAKRRLSALPEKLDKFF